MWPDEYVPLNGCRSCGRDFVSLAYFDRHRVGKHAYDFSIERPDGRRCMDEDELHVSGLRRVVEGDSARYDSRIASGVPIYWNPAEASRTRGAFRASPGAVDGTEALVGTEGGAASCLERSIAPPTSYPRSCPQREERPETAPLRAVRPLPPAMPAVSPPRPRRAPIAGRPAPRSTGRVSRVVGRCRS